MRQAKSEKQSNTTPADIIDDFQPATTNQSGKEYVDTNFRTLSDQPNRAMAGLSMGGMETKTITLRNLDKFSHIGLFIGGTISMDDVTNTEGFKSHVKLVSVSYGSKEVGGGGRRRRVGDPEANAKIALGVGRARVTQVLNRLITAKVSTTGIAPFDEPPHSAVG